MGKQNVIQEQYENAKRICGAIRGRTKHEGFRVGHLEYRELDLTISLIPDLLDTIEKLRAELKETQRQRDNFKHWYEVALERASFLEEEYE